MKTLIFSFVLPVTLSLSITMAQPVPPTPISYFNLGRGQDIAARPMALGGSYTAIASDGSALYYNAAGLSAVKKHELALSLERTEMQATDRAEGYATNEANQSLMRLQSLSFLLPIPTHRGGLTFAFGYSRPRTFSDLIQFDDIKNSVKGKYVSQAEGTLDQYRIGMGIDLSPDISFGLATGFVSGSEAISIFDSTQAKYFTEYRGINLEPSLMLKITPRLKLGMGLVLYEKMNNIKETYAEIGRADEVTDYEAEYPFQLKSGLAYQGNDFLLSADFKLNGWSQYRYGLSGNASLEPASYKDEVALSFGGEKFIAPLNMMLRGGYTYNTTNEIGYSPTYDLNRISTGIGFLMSGSLAVDLAYSYSFWGFSDASVNLDNREHRALMSLAYRF